MNKYTTISIAAFAVLFASGCTEWGNPPFRNAIPTESGPWKADVERISNEDDISFSSGSGKINNAGIAKLKDLVGKTTPQPPVHARVMTHTARGELTQLTEQRIGTIIRCLKKLGDIRPDMVEVMYVDQTESDRKHVITVSLDQYQAIAPKCPGWNEYMNTYGMPEGEANFGCTTATNVAKMVHDPYDMYQDRRDPALGPGDGPRQTLSVDRYRKGKEEPLKIERVESGR